VLGDFNARADSSVIQTVNGDGPRRLIDTHPVDQRHNDWTNFCAAKNEYSRIDYLLISQGVAANWLLDQSRVWDMDGWQTASDHRPILGAFRFE
jgi:endonuclease/exonuclease/phosphatase family metal-dependent hydrolase